MLPDIVITRSDRDRLANVIHSFLVRNQSALIDFLDQQVSRATVVDGRRLSPDVASMRSRVVFRDENSGIEKTVTLVYPGEEDSLTGKISITTPVGAALLGLAEGRSMEWTALDGRQRRVTLVRLVFQPEAAGLHHL